MKKVMLFGLALVIAMFGFTGCTLTKVPEDPGSDYDVNIDMTDEDYNQTAELVIGVTPDAYESNLINEAAKGFKELFPNVKITPEKITGADYATAVVGRFQGNNMPDIFYTSETESFRFISGGLYLNLKPYIKAHTAADAEWLNQFVPEAMKLGQKDYNGDQYFMPRSSDRIITHLNTKYINAALTSENRPDKSVTPEIVKNGWTWNDFLKVCQALRAYYNSQGWTAAGGRYILDATFTWSPVLFSLFKSNNASFTNDSGEWTLDSQETKNTISMIRQLVTEQIIAPTDGGGANYENGNGAMLFHSSSAITKYAGYLKEDYDVVTFPVINGESGVTGYGVPGYGIYSGISANKRDLAWQFLNYVVSLEGQNTLAKAGMATPSVRTQLQDPQTSEWGKEYRHLNLEATVYEGKRNYSETFFLNFDATVKNALLGASSKFVSNITTYTGGEFSFSAEKCISQAIADLKKASIVK